MKPKVSIILPTYNERENIIELINRISAVINNKEIIVIDDNSPDGTAYIVKETYKDNPDVRLIIRTHERGLASAVKRGIDESRGQILVWMDCDLSMAPEKIPDLIDKIKKENFDVAVGSRYVRGGADVRMDSGKLILYFHTLLSLIITRVTSLMLYKSFLDWTSGFIAIKACVAKHFPIRGDYGEYFIEFIYSILKSGLSVVEVPYHLTHREKGESKTATNVIGFIKRGSKYIANILRLRFTKRISLAVRNEGNK